jgi:hypothetical protein
VATIKLNQEGDLLTLEFTKPYKGQQTADLGNGVSVRVHAETGVVESAEILVVVGKGFAVEIPERLPWLVAR